VSQARRPVRNRRHHLSDQKVLRTGLREIVFIFFCFASLYLFVSLATYYPLDPGFSHGGVASEEVRNQGGLAGAYFADLFFYWFGYFAYLFAFMVGYVGWLVYQGRHHDLIAEPRHLVVPGIGFVLTLIAGCGIAIVHFAAESALLPSHAGGILGSWIGNGLKNMLSSLGATLLLLVMFFTGITLLTGLSWLKLMDRLGLHTLYWLPIVYEQVADRLFPWLGKYLRKIWQVSARQVRRLYQYFRDGLLDQWEIWQENRRERREAEERERYEDEEQGPPPAVEAPVAPPVASVMAESKEETPAATATPTPLPSLAHLIAPTLPEPQRIKTAQEQLADTVELALQALKLAAKVKAVHPGPVITRVEIQPSRDQLSQIIALSDRLIEQLNIPKLRLVETGPELICLEVPNANPEAIPLSGLLSLQAYIDSRSPLTIALGKDSSGQAVIIDLARIPHLLIAGNDQHDLDFALHALLLSLLFKATADELRLILIDSKRKILNHYRHLPHLLTPVINETVKAESALRWCVAEMERRYRLMADLGVRNIDGYNQKLQETEAQTELQGGIPTALAPIPYVVVMIHELAEVASGESGRSSEELITRLAQKARAAGIHMVLASQHPGVNTITGLMKSNFPTRIAFRVDHKNDARNLLGQPGAQDLLGRGDMFYLTPGTGIPARVHGAQVTLQEVQNVVEDLKKLGKPQYQDLTAGI